MARIVLTKDMMFAQCTIRNVGRSVIRCLPSQCDDEDATGKATLSIWLNQLLLLLGFKLRSGVYPFRGVQVVLTDGADDLVTRIVESILVLRDGGVALRQRHKKHIVLNKGLSESNCKSSALSSWAVLIPSSFAQNTLTSKSLGKKSNTS